MNSRPLRLNIDGGNGAKLAARLDLPAGPARAFALFAHCFTCSKDIFAASRIAAGLSQHGIAVLRFDFTGLGASEGEFASTNFSSNVADLVTAANYLRDHYSAPSILIGHSLGGAAVLAAADQVPEVVAVATLGAPADAEHVIHNFGAKIDEIDEKGEASVSLAGRDFTIQKQFLDDVRASTLTDKIAKLKRALLVLHAPGDQTVGIENAGEIFAAAKHPKSFVSLDTADHLISKRPDAEYAANMIAAWAARFIGQSSDKDGSQSSDAVLVQETGNGKFQQNVVVGPHHLFADEPKGYGGDETGPTPYDFVGIGLGACTSMTLRLYAERKKLPLDRVSVKVTHGKVHADDCAECTEGHTGRIDRFERRIQVDGDLTDEQRQRLLEIADKCPVHKTLEQSSVIATLLDESS